MKNITIYDLTESQKEAFNFLNSFVSAPITRDINSRVAVLVGKAGTGKTTLIKLVLDELLTKDREMDRDTDFQEGASLFASPNVMGVTVAHKAKNVLAKSIHFVNTFASYFGLKEEYTDTGQLKFVRNPYRQSKANCRLPHVVAVHDECSMYDAEMLKTVLEDTNYGTKIIFMGDPGQLPPISAEDDDDSPVFTKFKNVIHLTERVRQTEGNPIVDLSDVIYSQIFRKIKKGEPDNRISIVLDAIKSDAVNEGQGFISIRNREFLNHYKSNADHFNSKVVAYRRQKVNDFNDVIRRSLYNNPTAEFIPTEIIYMNDSFYSEKNSNEKSKSYICYNSDEYVIEGIEKGVDIMGVDCDLLYIDKTKHMHLANIDMPFIPVVSKKGKKEYNMIANARKNAVFQAEPYKRPQRWKYYYDFIGLFGNVSYGYCYTAHKSQGSTFKTVYVDINDILTIGPITDKRKLQAIYTAITRASHLVVFLKSN